MLFNSVAFLIFFPVVVTLYFVTPPKWRWLLLLVASYYFYMSWKAEYALLILLSTVVDYAAGLRMANLAEKRDRRKYLILSLVVNLGLLFTFKYFNFFSNSLNVLFDVIGLPLNSPVFDLLLPVGISFYTFQTLTYTIDIYRGTLKPERHFGIFALYVAFWPQLVAGPIERASHLLPQFRETFNFDYDRVRRGLLLMLWGFFKKVVIADRLAIYVNMVYDAPDEYTGWPAILATIFFAFQIYCDFSGYSDIAIGAARVMGFDLMDNFKRPYFSKSISEFWRRWHISLSTWFRDYVYIPLGGNRVPQGRLYFNLMVTFLVSGLWHGANWTFVIWGGLHGMLLVASVAFAGARMRMMRGLGLNSRPRLLNAVQLLGTFLLVTLGWVFFRSNSVADALTLLGNMPQNLGDWSAAFLPNTAVVYSLFLIGVLLMQEKIVQDNTLDQVLLRQRALVRWGFYTAVVLVILWFGVFTQSEFIYFQF